MDTYTQRKAHITALLQPYLDVSAYVFAPTEPNPTERPNGLACQWFDRTTGSPAVSVFIDELTDVDRALEGLREQVTGDGPYEPGMATELAGQAPGEYVFLMHNVPSVRGIIGNCQVAVYPPAGYRDLNELVEPALEIG